MTGLRVEPPQGYDARSIELVREDGSVIIDAAFLVDSTSEKFAEVGQRPALCEIGFAAEPSYERFTQDELNAWINSQERVDDSRLIFADPSDILEERAIEIAGAFGMEFISDEGEIRGYLALVDTPAGRTVISCGAPMACFDDLLGDFRAIRNGITPPN